MKQKWSCKTGLLLGCTLLLGSIQGYAADDDIEQDLQEIVRMAENIGASEKTQSLATRLQQANPRPFPKGAEWFKDAGWGLFIHWGPSSSPDYDVSWTMRRPKKGDPRTPQAVPSDWYDHAPKDFTAANYDPQKWMAAAKKAGFEYAVLTSKHHDGYALWPTEHSDLGVRTCLNGRDLIQPFVDAVRDHDMRLGFYFSGVDWWLAREYMNYKFSNQKGDPGWDFYGNPMDPEDEPNTPWSVIEQGRQMVFEVMDRYRPDIWWWDSGLPVTFEETSEKYNPAMIFNNRGNFYRGGKHMGTFPGSDYVTPEGLGYAKWKDIKVMIEKDVIWEVCHPLTPKWFYTMPYGERVKNMTLEMFAFARIRAWNGKLLINVGPRADGTLTEAVYEAFDKMARWMEWGAPSVKGTHGTTHFPEHANVPITLSKDEKTWYLHATPIDGDAYKKLNKWDKAHFEFTEPGKPIRVEDMPKVASVKLLRSGKALDYTYEDGVLILPNPYAGPDGLHEVVEVRIH